MLFSSNDNISRNHFSILQIILILLFISTWNQPIKAKEKISIYIIGPTFSKHFKNPGKNLREFHLGIGAEIQWKYKCLLLGWHGYYMDKDSLDHKSYWTGLTVGIHIVKPKKFRITPFLIVGGIKKREYHAGKFSFLLLPVLSFGYKWFGINLGIIPKIPDVTNPLLYFQFKIKL